MLYKLAKNSHFLQNLVIRIIASIHPSIEHNVDKVKMLKKAFWHCELEKIDGAYFEFGVYEGSSLYAATQIEKKINSAYKRYFYGYDSFDDGFKYFDDRDKHPFFKEGDFKSSYDKTLHRFKGNDHVHLVKGYFEETVQGKNIADRYPGTVCAIIYIDCDLMGPAKIALDYVRPALQSGSVIILDDYWAYRGNPSKGTAGAFKDFLMRNPNIQVREYYNYGHGGKSFIVKSI